jgi:hypothetical protein
MERMELLTFMFEFWKVHEWISIKLSIEVQDKLNEQI